MYELRTTDAFDWQVTVWAGSLRQWDDVWFNFDHQLVNNSTLGMGAMLTVPEPNRIHIEAPEPLPGEFVAALREHKAELLVLLSTEATWPPPDSEELLARWETQGCQEIPVSPGVSISNLRTWLYPDYPQDRLAEHLSAVRGWLIEGLPALEVEVDPLLERWRRMCLPQWREKLRDAGAAGDERGVEYAAYILDLLGDDEATE